MNLSIAGLVPHVIQHPYWILNVAPVAWIGRVSYSIYLWQQPFFFNSNPHSPLFPLWGLVLACISYYLIEQPILRYRDRKRSTASRSEERNRLTAHAGSMSG
jgi:peptidoglycan/LPS O-acetylase OafA/YrhL